MRVRRWSLLRKFTVLSLVCFAAARRRARPAARAPDPRPRAHQRGRSRRRSCPTSSSARSSSPATSTRPARARPGARARPRGRAGALAGPPRPREDLAPRRDRRLLRRQERDRPQVRDRVRPRRGARGRAGDRHLRRRDRPSRPASAASASCSRRTCRCASRRTRRRPARSRSTCRTRRSSTRRRPTSARPTRWSRWRSPCCTGCSTGSSRAPRSSLRRQALHDPLTGLPNRRCLYQHVEGLIERGAGVSLLLADLDGFKELNDTLGHHAGDLVLTQLGPRARARAARASSCSRASAATSSPSSSRAATPRRSPRRSATALAEPFVVDGIRLAVRASIGIAHYPNHGQDVGALLQRADIAMYQAKARQAGWLAYEPTARRAQQGAARAGRRVPARDLGRRARRPLPAEGRAGDAARSPASRRSSAGTTPTTACSRRRSSCRWPSRPT